MTPAVTGEDLCQMQRLLVVDEHRLIQAGLRAVFIDAPWVAGCLVANSAEVAWQLARQRRPHLALVSMSLGGRSAIELCRTLSERTPRARVVLMSTGKPVSAAAASAYGASASLSKLMAPAMIVATVRQVAAGSRIFPKDVIPDRRKLSKRELDVLQRLASGLSNPEVGAALNLSRHTIKQHTSAIYRKLGVRNRAEAARRAHELGLLAWEQQPTGGGGWDDAPPVPGPRLSEGIRSSVARGAA